MHCSCWEGLAAKNKRWLIEIILKMVLQASLLYKQIYFNQAHPLLQPSFIPSICVFASFAISSRIYSAYFGSLIHSIKIQIMEDKIANNELQKATSRRSRKDQEGRDFQCGCGKRYLSYPALYTHIKTKHDGRQPEGTLKTGTNQIAKRTKGKLQEEAVKSICGYFHKEDLRIFTELEDGIAGSIPLGSRVKKDIVPKETYECYMSLMKQKEVKLQSHSSLDLALTVYLFNVGYYVNEKIYEQFLSFARIARSCFHDHGDEVYRAYFSKKDLGSAFTLPTFSINEVKYFPIVSDFIIQIYIPYTELKEGREINMSLMELLVFDFCNWLYLHKLTMIKTSLSKDYRLDFKPTLAKVKNTPNKADHREANSKENREQNEEQSDEISENEEIVEDEQGEEEKKHSGDKEKDSNPLE